MYYTTIPLNTPTLQCSSSHVWNLLEKVVDSTGVKILNQLYWTRTQWWERAMCCKCYQTNRYAAIALLYSAAIVISSWLRHCIVFLETLLNMSQMSGLLMAMVASKKVFKGGPSPGAPAPGHVLPGAHKFPCPSCTRECSELCLVRTVYITSTKCAYCNALLAGFIYNTSAFCNRSGALNLRHVQCIRPTPVVLRSSQTMNHPFHDFHCLRPHDIRHLAKIEFMIS